MIEFPEGYEISKDHNIEAKLNTGGAAYKLLDIGKNNNIAVWHPDVSLNAN